jgi:hypothetical protein
LSGRSTRQQLAESGVLHEFFFADVGSPVYKCPHHHCKMRLRSAESSYTVEQNSFEKGYMTKQHALINIENLHMRGRDKN